jgi:hypothetical protein
MDFSRVFSCRTPGGFATRSENPINILGCKIEVT